MKKTKLSKIFIRNYIFVLLLLLLSFILMAALFHANNNSDRYTTDLSADTLMNDDYNSIDYTKLAV